MRRKKRKANPVVATRLRASALLEREDPMGFSVNTNTQAVLALQGLAKTDKELGVVQKRVSSGLRVADARDDGGAFAAALSVRSDVAGLSAVNEQLGGVKGIVETTFAALNKVSDTMKNLRQVVTRLADSSISTDQRAQYETQFSALTSQITNFIDDSKYNGRTLLSTVTAAGGGDIAVLRNENADSFDVLAVDGVGIASAPRPLFKASILSLLNPIWLSTYCRSEPNWLSAVATAVSCVVKTPVKKVEAAAAVLTVPPASAVLMAPPSTAAISKVSAFSLRSTSMSPPPAAALVESKVRPLYFESSMKLVICEVSASNCVVYWVR